MKNKKNIILAAILAIFSISITSANANSLTQMDIKKSSVADTVDVTFYTTDVNSNTVVTRKGNNRYVVLMPNVSSNSSVTPNFGGLKDLITDVNVKHVDDGIGGYTKVTFETTKPINIKTHNVKSAPLTQAQKDAKNIIAQNNTTPAATTAKPQTTPAPSTTAQKPATAQQTQPAATQQAKPAASTKTTSAPKTTADTSKATPKATVATVPKITITKPAETKPIKQSAAESKTTQPKVKTAKNDFVDSNYKPKMNFDKDGKRKVSLEPRVSHPVENTSSAKTPNADISKDNVIETDNLLETGIPEIDETPIPENKSNFPLIVLLAGGAIVGLGTAYLILDAIANKSKKDNARNNSFLSLSAQNHAKRRRQEYYDIVNNKDLSWQEKYKLYTQKEQEYSPLKEEDPSFVTNLGASKKAILMPQEKVTPVKLSHVMKRQEKSHNDIVREKLQAKISQMEHSLAQTPTNTEPVETPKGVQSEDNSIVNTMKNIKLKSFSKPVSLKETNRSLAENPFSSKESFKEGPFVKLNDSELSVNRRNSTSSAINIRNLINSGNKYLTNNGETNMKNQKENYLTSSLDEYLSILDSESSKSTIVADTLSQIRSTSTPDSVSRSGVSNPISRSKDSSLSAFHGGMIVRSGYSIDSDRGIYLVNVDGVSALVGRVKDNITMLKKFSQVLDKPLQVRPENDNVYIARVGNYKCLVDVTKDKMGTLIEI
jgi:hypothetical protein